MHTRPVQLDVYRTAIPMRTFEHAAASRDLSEAVLVRVQFEDGEEGWGETLPRPYVTGETFESVLDDIRDQFWPHLVGRDVDGEWMPTAFRDTSVCHNAAACAMDVACLQRWFTDASWTHLNMHGIPADWKARRKQITARVSGVLGSANPAKTSRKLRLMRWAGLKDFKLKLGFGQEVDNENLRMVHRQLAGSLAAGKCTLRVDINGGWDAATTPDRISALRQYNVCAVEQPVYCSAPELADLACKCPLPLIADESLLNDEDANVLLQAGARVWWNIRLSKNGGFAPALKLARQAAENCIPVVLGCMVGETSILSATQRLLLQFMPSAPRFVEGNYGRFLLADDISSRWLRWGYGGRLKALGDPGLGVPVDTSKLSRYATHLQTLK